MSGSRHSATKSHCRADMSGWRQRSGSTTCKGRTGPAMSPPSSRTTKRPGPGVAASGSVCQRSGSDGAKRTKAPVATTITTRPNTIQPSIRIRSLPAAREPSSASGARKRRLARPGTAVGPGRCEPVTFSPPFGEGAICPAAPPRADTRQATGRGDATAAAGGPPAAGRRDVGALPGKAPGRAAHGNAMKAFWRRAGGPLCRPPAYPSGSSASVVNRKSSPPAPA